jgi:hypothetical protein
MVTKIPSRSTLFAGELAPIGSVLPYLGATPPSTPTAAATATLTFGDTEFDDVNNGTLALISVDGTSRTYTIRNDYGASTNIQFNAATTASACAANLKIAIEHADGHNGKLTVVQSDGQLTITQATSGIEGNTVITTASSFDNSTDVNIGSRFTEGASKGWLYCDGTVISRTIYASLFAQISTTYGVGDGSTTFSLPDLRGRFLVGRDSMGVDTAPARVASVAEGIDASTLGATGGKVTVADGSKSQGVVCNWIIRASEDD